MGILYTSMCTNKGHFREAGQNYVPLKYIFGLWALEYLNQYSVKVFIYFIEYHTQWYTNND